MLLVTGFTILQNSWIQTRIAQHIAANLSETLQSKISIEKVEIGLLKKIKLDNVLIEDQHGDTLIYSNLISAKIDTLQIRRNKISIRKLNFNNNRIYIEKDSVGMFNFRFLTEKFNKNTDKDSSNIWKLSCKDFGFNNVNFHYTDANSDTPPLKVNGLSILVSDIYTLGDSASLTIKDLKISDGQGFTLKHSNAKVSYKDNRLQLLDFNLKSSGSFVNNVDADFKFYTAADSMNRPFDVDISINESNISLSELSLFFPQIDGMNQRIAISGDISGNINDLKGKNITFKTGRQTSATVDFYINDLLNSDKMYLFIDLKKAETSFNDIGNIRLPNNAKNKYIQFSDKFYDVGIMKFNGNFSGFLSDFVTYGTLESSVGTLKTDILVTPGEDGNIAYSGKISTIDFNLGQLFQIDSLETITFNGEADAQLNPKSNKLSGLFKGDIAHIKYKGYDYKNITIDGKLSEKLFDGLLKIKDPNLDFLFLGRMDYTKEIPVFNFKLNLQKALLGKLNLSEKFPKATIALRMQANFAGNKIDNFNGDISIENVFYQNKNGEINLQGADLKASSNEVKFTSPFFDATVSGYYHFNSLKREFVQIAKQYIPTIKDTINHTTTTTNNKNNFTCSLNVKDINPLINLFNPNYTFETPFLLHGKINTAENSISIEGNIPGIKYKNYWGRDIHIGNKTINNTVESKFKIGELYGRNGLTVYNITLNSKLSDNELDNTLSWGNFDKITYSGSFKTKTAFSYNNKNELQANIKGYKSNIYIADTAWTIEPFNLKFNKSDIIIDSFNTHHNGQIVAIDGKITNKKADMLHLKMMNIDLSYLKKYFKRNIAVAGIINGEVSFSKKNGKPILLSDLSIDSLFYKDEFMGNIFLQTKWNNAKSAIDSKLKIDRNNHLCLGVSGTYAPTSGGLDFNVKADSASLLVMEAFMGANFSNFKGTGSGQVHIGGNINNILLNGALMGNNAGMTIDATQVAYSFNDSVYFRDNVIDFGQMTVYDDENNSGTFEGTITHQNFNHRTYNMVVSSKKIKALNTTSKDNSHFYGTAVANAKIQITGRGKNVLLNCTGKTLSGTDLKISMENESDIGQYDFIKFAKEEEKASETPFEVKEKEEEKGGFKLSMNVEATPEAKVQLIYNSQIGDVIKAQGEGFLQFEYDYLNNMSLSGNFNPTNGDYLFTLQNVINKRFTLASGGSIVWSGDPYNAIIDLQAIYTLRASLYDLLNEYEDISQSSRIPVECVIKLTDELMNPTISFDVNFPGVESRVQDELAQYFNTEEEMNKQILSLIIMGKFYTPEYMRGNYESQSANAIGSTVSEMFSNQLSNWFSQIDENWDVGINYRPGGQTTDDEVELALSTQIFNDRVTLNGNIGNNTNQYNTNSNSSQIVGDFEMNVKLIPSGKILFKAYHRSNNNLIYETDPYTQGIGLSFKEEFNSFDELLKKFGTIFKKRKNKKKKAPKTSK